MAICSRCNQFYLGSECPFCRVDPDKLREDKERAEAQEKIDSFLISTSPLLDGYQIAEYLDVVTGSSVIGTGFLSEFKASFSDFFGSSSEAFSSKLEKVKDVALARARDNAIARGANALIGVSIAYQSFSANMIAAVVSGTAVTIKNTAKESSK